MITITITLSQEVKNFNDSDSIVKQEVMIEVEAQEDWVSVDHDYMNISCSLENWNKLVELVKQAEIKAKENEK